ncbi:MAG: hypothetical protein EA356_02760 [Geminicoccaceae bacterium]|nr:MAG: hypothetical protein EA356_02760 [Geminicoccaceae bacterium]
MRRAGLLVTASFGAVLGLAAAGGVAPPAAAQSMDAGEMVVRLQEMQEELARLRGEVEELRFRQRRLEEAMAAAPATPPTAAPTTVAPPSPAPAPAPAPASPSLPTVGGTLGGGPPTADTLLDQPDLPAGFDRGMAFAQAGRWAAARQEFDAFVAANPNDPRAPEAAFWSADSLFVEGEFGAAAAAFAANYRAFGADAPFAVDSLLKVAMSLIELGDRERACLTLDELVRRHRNLGRALEAGVARERARAGCP